MKFKLVGKLISIAHIKFTLYKLMLWNLYWAFSNIKYTILYMKFNLRYDINYDIVYVPY